jgi:histidinol-phosphate aminotransferase
MDLKHLSTIDRIRIPETRDYKNGYLMNRNERVVPWPKETIENVLKTIHPNEWNMYHNVKSLYKKIARYNNLDEDEILVVNGAEDGINRCYQVFVKEGTNVGYLYPTYAMYYVYTDAYKANGYKIGYNVNKHEVKLDKDYLYEILPKLDIIFLANPNHFLDNLKQEDIEKICEIGLQNNVIVVLDEVAGGFGVYRAKELINKYSNLLVINSFSKEYGLPTIRVGYLIGNKKLIKACAALRISYEISMFSQKFAEYVLDHINEKEKYCDEVVEGREFCVKELEKIGVKCNNDNAVYFNPYFENIKQKEYVIQRLIDEKIYVKNYRNDMYNGKFEHFITVAGAPKYVMVHFLKHFKKAYLDFNESSIISDNKTYDALYYNKN